MKNVLSYYYNLNPTDIHLSNGIYKFEYNNESYILYPTNLEQSELENSYKLSLYLLNKGIFSNQIIPDINNNIFIVVNNEKYILMKVHPNYEKQIGLIDIINFSNNSYIEIKSMNKWYNLWEKKLDYFEYQISQFGKKYPIIRESFSYYLGISETGITLLNNLNINEENNYIAHKRINYKMSIMDFYNPLNYIVDSKSRDISEYLKSKLIDDKNELLNIKMYLEYLNLNENEIKLFFIRLFYCSFYFDQYEKVLNGEDDEESLIEIINKTNNYEVLLKKIYDLLYLYIQLPNIEWIKKI